MVRRVRLGVVLSTLAAGLAGSAGCSPEPAQRSPSLDQPVLSNPEAATAQFDVPPRRLLEVTKEVLASQPYNLGVAKEEGGRILTEWQRLPGQFRIARRWQERTRYLVTVAPEFDDPANKSQLIVMQETQTRATDGQDWKPQMDIDRSERARQLAQDISQRVGGRQQQQQR